MNFAHPKKFIVILFLIVLVGIILFFLISDFHISVLFTRKDIHYQYPHSNIILISIDTLRADHLGCYGYKKNTSPHIDKFSEESVLFKQTIAHAPTTLPSHASIFTSLIPSHHGSFHTPLSEDMLTMAEILKLQGYQTVSFNDGGYVSAKFGFDQGFDLYDSFAKAPKGTFKNRVNKAIKWIKENHPDKFFLFLHTYEVHHPYTPKEEYLTLFEDDYSGNLPSDISVDLLKDINEKKLIIDKEDKSHIINTYDAEIRSMDQSFSELLNFLRENNLYDSTLIIFTSDHGEEFGEHGLMGWHGVTLFDEVLHIPLIIKFPNSAFSKTVVDQQVRSIDILPTLLNVLDIKTGKIFEGTSLLRLIKGKKEMLYAVSEIGRRKKSIRTESLKYYKTPSSEMLFDLIKDPLEQTDISEDYLDTTKRLKNALESFLNKRPQIFDKDKPNLDKKTLESLKALGYIR